MKTKAEPLKIELNAFQDICWPVKIRVRATSPLVAPRKSPVFPASLTFPGNRDSVPAWVGWRAPGSKQRILRTRVLSAPAAPAAKGPPV
jgi:hypothetical protein